MEKKEIQKIETNAISPVAQLGAQLAKGDITADQMEKLLDVQLKWEKNEAKKAYHQAMSLFQANVPQIIKTAKGHNCTYAKLPEIVAVVAPLLSENGLSHSWVTGTSDAEVKVVCKITHVMGHSEETELSAGSDKTGSKNDVQALGSTITYLQRYTLKAALGLAESDQDDDGAGADKGKDETGLRERKDIHFEVARAIAYNAQPKLPQGRVASETMIMQLFLKDKGAYPEKIDRVGDAVKLLMGLNELDRWTKEVDYTLPKPSEKAIEFMQAVAKGLDIPDSRYLKDDSVSKFIHAHAGDNYVEDISKVGTYVALIMPEIEKFLEPIKK